MIGPELAVKIPLLIDMHATGLVAVCCASVLAAIALAILAARLFLK